MYYYINNFIFFSILGFFFETGIFKLLHLHNQSGFMYGIWTPFYGTGVLLTIGIFKLIDKTKLSKLKKNILLFIIYFFVFSLLEESGGIILEYLHGYYLWDYKVVPLHLGKYISVPTSLLWSTFALTYLYIIKDITDQLIKKIPKWLTILLSIVFMIDFILTMIKLLTIKSL